MPTSARFEGKHNEQHGGQWARAVARPLISIPSQYLALPHGGVPVAGDHPEYVERSSTDPISVVGAGGDESRGDHSKPAS